MSDLYPTKTRLALLRDVARCKVYLSSDGNDYRDADSFWPRKVNAAIAEQERAGWVELGERDEFGTRYWQLTDAGRDLLNARGGQS